MRNICLAAATCVLGLSNAGYAGDIRITVSGVAGGVGQIGCGLHKSEESFPMGHQGVPTVWVRPQGTTANCVFENVPPGTYAVAVAHDINGNHKTDTNFLGLPKEAWGVSRNARPAMRAPRFDEATFSVAENVVTLEIEVKK